MSDRFELPSELNIYSALQTRDALLAWVTEQTKKGQEHFDVFAGKVNEVDGSGLQLLASLGNMGHAWNLVEPSSVFQEACNTMGFAHWLGTDAHSSKGAA